MNKFKLGAHVRVVKGVGHWKNYKGYVVQIRINKQYNNTIQYQLCPQWPPTYMDKTNINSAFFLEGSLKRIRA